MTLKPKDCKIDLIRDYILQSAGISFKEDEISKFYEHLGALSEDLKTWDDKMNLSEAEPAFLSCIAVHRSGDVFEN